MLVEVRICTNSPRPGVQELGEGRLKVRVKAKPVQGKANAEVIELLAEHYRVARQKVRIVLGASSKRKKVEVNL